MNVTCAGVALAALSCAGQSAVPSPSPGASTPVRPALSDPCGGSQELLKKYLSASPCVFVRGQASLQMTYSGTNVPVVVSEGPQASQVVESSHAFGYPGALLNVGVTPTSQVTIVLPSFSQISSTQKGVTAGASDVEFRYKQFISADRKRGILTGLLLTYEAPTGSPGLAAPGPAYEINPLVNVALNGARTIAANFSFPVSNATNSDGAARSWSFAPQGVVVWRSPGGTLLAGIVQYAFGTHSTFLTFNAAQLLSRNFQVQGTYGGNDATVDYVNPIQDVAQARATVYSRSFTIGISYLVGNSEPLSP